VLLFPVFEAVGESGESASTGDLEQEVFKAKEVGADVQALFQSEEMWPRSLGRMRCQATRQNFARADRKDCHGMEGSSGGSTEASIECRRGHEDTE